MKKVILNTLKNDIWKILICVVFIGINMYLLTLPAGVIGKIIDLLYTGVEGRQEVLKQVLYLMGLSFLILIVRLIWKYYDTCIPRKFEMEIRNNLFSKLLRIKPSKLEDRKNGELMSYFVKDVNEVRFCIHHLLSFGTRIVFTLIFATYAMVKNVDLRLTLISLSPLVVTVFIITIIKEKLNESYKKSQLEFTELSEYIQESTDAIYTTKAYHGEAEQIKHFISVNKKVRKQNYLNAKYSAMLSVALNICFGLCYGLAILFGAPLVINGSITIGDFVAFNTYIALFVNPIAWVPSVITRIRRGTLSYRRISELYDVEVEPHVKMLGEKSENDHLLSGDIEIKDLSFYYPGFIEPALQNININIKSGQTLGIIGEIGSGKSTLMNLLVKLYAVPRGKITISGIDINDLPTSFLRENVCYITQDNFLFSATLKENINLFRDEYDDDEIIDSTKKAMIYDEILKLPDSINTVIGERGIDLSGGQKQRVVISRAFLNESDIVIFDDTFSALDNRTEQKVLKNIKGLVKGKTCVIVSNRISDIKHADNIVVLSGGAIVESGTHKELIAAEGTYYKFYKEQALKTEDGIFS